MFTLCPGTDVTGSIGAQMGGDSTQLAVDAASLVDPGWLAVRRLGGGDGHDGEVGLVPENYLRPSEETEAADAETDAYVCLVVSSRRLARFLN